MDSGTLIGAGQVRLDVEESTRAGALRAAADLLRGDARVSAWEDLWVSSGERQVVELEGCGVCLAHGRGGVKELVLAAVRLASPVVGESGAGLRVVFFFGIPEAMAEEYLRAVGALVRACRCAERLDELLAATTPDEFAACVEEWAG
jgi:mannitol/fructose-specific phosphotransferase system IIA component (Ntr-type)